MGKIARFYCICFSVVMLGCSPRPPVVRPDVGDVDACSSACDNFARLGCEESKGGTGPDGKPVTCVEICRRVVPAGFGLGQD